MRIDSIGDFLQCVGGNDVWFTVGRKRYFINGAKCEIDEKGRTTAATMSVHELDASDRIVSTIFTAKKESSYACVAAFVNDFKLDSKSFFELARHIEWSK